MQVTVQTVESAVLGGTALSLDGFSLQEDFPAFETSYCQTYQPCYVACKLPLQQIAEIHALELYGFGFMECQLKLELRPRKSYPTDQFPFVFELVQDEQTLQEVLAIAGATFVHDRFSTDPLLPPGVSGERYRRYVAKSFAAADEFVYRLVDPATRQTLAFKTHRIVNEEEALLLLGGVAPEMKALGLGALNGYHELNVLRERGIRRVITHISAANHPIFNLEVSKFGYRVLETFALLRKVYGTLT
ncbi:MAG: GNAT family protein [Armatimonadota bacterium]